MSGVIAGGFAFDEGGGAVSGDNGAVAVIADRAAADDGMPVAERAEGTDQGPDGGGIGIDRDAARQGRRGGFACGCGSPPCVKSSVGADAITSIAPAGKNRPGQGVGL